MASTRAALALIAAGAVGVAVVSGGSSTDPRTPVGLPGLPPPFLGTAVVGSGGLTAAVDAYGDVVDMRAPGPAGAALIDNPADRQAAGSVPSDTGIVPRVSWAGSKGLRSHRHTNPSSSAGEPLWRADSVAQRYLPGTNVMRTIAQFGPVRVSVIYAARGGLLACLTSVRAALGEHARVSLATADAQAANRLRCDDRAARTVVGNAVRSDRRWLAHAAPLGAGAPAWATRLYRRSLLTLRALTDARTGAVAAGARDGWAYVWPRDAGTAALALAASGYRPEARRVARFLLRLNLGAAARFHGDGSPVAGRGPQGDAAGWAAVAARAAGLPPPTQHLPWRNRPDYQEGTAGTYLANAISSAQPAGADGPKTSDIWTFSARRPRAMPFETPRGLVRRAGDPGSGLDSAAAWAVRPFAQPALFPAVHRTLRRLAAGQTRFGITPGAAWAGGEDPWTAPTAWSAWSLAALADRERRESFSAAARRDRGAALHLLGDLRRAATPAGALPERVDARSGVPRSTTPLAWSHAFAILALRELWPSSIEPHQVSGPADRKSDAVRLVSAKPVASG